MPPDADHHLQREPDVPLTADLTVQSGGHGFDGCLSGGGEMGALMRAYDWSASPLGPVENWPQGLKTAVRIVLTSRFAMWMGWGDELTFLYNDAYGRMTLGKKHPWALGKPAREVWAEIWADIGPRIERVTKSGETTWDEALLLFLERSGYPEETYHTFSYSPLSDDTGNIAGMLCVVTEETERVIGERRLGFLRELGTALAAASTQEQIFAAVRHCIENQPQDLAFTLSYLLENNGKIARLVATTGVPANHPIAIAELAVDDPASPWPLSSMMEQADSVLVEDLNRRFPSLPAAAPWDKPATRAIMVPFSQQGQESAAGFLVAGLNPYRQFDTGYRGFIRLLASQITASLASAQAYEQERRRAEALAELDRAKTNFFSNISHEFRTPLTLMLGPIEDALTDAGDILPARQRERLEIAHRNTVRLLKLANNLLDFTRIEAGRMQASFEPIDLAALTADLASSFRSAMERASLHYEVDCPPLPEPVYVDRDMWEKIVLNLLSNAFKYTLSGGVYVSLKAVGNHVEFAVRDTGEGIPEKELPRVFERFHRAEGTRGRTHEGTGIGLALTQELVRQHGGEVRVQSVLGEGTTFTVVLPLGAAHLPVESIAHAAPQRRASTALSSDAYTGEALHLLPSQQEGESARRDSATEPAITHPDATARILVADDNADMRAYMTRLLREQRYDVEAVTNGREALEAIRRKRPDLVLSDVMMPQMDGFALLLALRSQPETSALPVVLISARAGEDARVEGIDAGADDYLVKPFSRRELLARVSSLLQLVKVRREAAEAAERFQAAFGHAAVGLAITDTSGRFLEINPAFRQILGYADQELLGRDMEALIHSEDRERSARLVEQLRQGTIPSFTVEKRYVRKDGSAVWVQCSVSLIRDEQRHPRQIIFLCEDIGERVLARQEREEMLLAAQRRAEREALLNRLGEAIRILTEPEEILVAAVRELGQAMNTDRCYFAEYDVARDWARVGADWHRPGLHSLTGTYRLSELDVDAADMFSGPGGLLYAEDLTTADPGIFSPRAAAILGNMGLRSVLGVGIFENGLPVAALVFAMAQEPRAWTLEEIELLRTAAALTRSAMEDARLRKREHNIAERLQEALQPSSPGRLPGLELDTHYRPALREASIGGDFYDVFAIEEGCYALVVADLSGKGLAAASQVSTVRHMLRSLLYLKGTTLAQTITALNEMLVEHDLLEGFSTLFVGTYDVNQRTLTYVNAGQEPGLILRRAMARIEQLRPTGPVLGGFGDAAFEERMVTLTPGDVLALFTDGLTEAGPSRKDLLGVKGVISVFQQSAREGSTAEEIIANMIAGVEAVATPSGIRDDVCLLVGCVE